MKVVNQIENKIIIEFDLIDFESLKDFFLEQKEAVSETGKFEYEAIQKILAIKLEHSSFVNDMRLKRINHIFDENEKLLGGKKDDSNAVQGKNFFVGEPNKGKSNFEEYLKENKKTN